MILKAVGWSPVVTLPLLAALLTLGFEELPSTAWAVALAAALGIPPIVMVLHLRLTSTLSAAVKQAWTARLRGAQVFDVIWSYLLAEDRSDVASLGIKDPLPTRSGPC